jgi:hypothetical protein
VNCCQTALPDDAVFCGHCGNALRVTHVLAVRKNDPGREVFFASAADNPSCQPKRPRRLRRVLTPRSTLPRRSASRSALEGERKQVSAPAIHMSVL